MMAENFSKKLQIESDLAEGARVVNTIVDQAQTLGYDDASRFAIRLAMDEALANAIKHGNANDPTRQVVIEYDITPEKITVAIEDEGCGFNPEAVPDPTLDENIERPHGRGVMLMKAYMTTVDYNAQGNRVVMTKQRVCGMPKKSSK